MQVVSLGRAARQKAALKVRQPLAEMLVKVKSPDEARPSLARLREQMLDELNVKSLGLREEDSELVTYVLRPVPSLLGPKYGKRMPAIQAALAALDARQAARVLRAGEPLAVTGRGDAAAGAGRGEGLRQRAARVLGGRGGRLRGGGVHQVTPELRREGLARELVRRLQDMRKNAGLDIADRIHVRYQAGDGLAGVLAEFGARVAQEILAISLEAGEGDGYREEMDLDGDQVVFWISKAG